MKLHVPCFPLGSVQVCPILAFVGWLKRKTVKSTNSWNIFLSQKINKSYLVCSLVLHPLSIVPETALFFFFLKPVVFIPDISLHCIFFRFWIHVQYRQPSVSEHLVRQRSAEFKFLIFANSCFFGDLYLTPWSTHFNSSGKILLFSSISYASVWESVAFWQSRSKRFSSPSCLVWQCQLFKLKKKKREKDVFFSSSYQIYYYLR